MAGTRTSIYVEDHFAKTLEQWERGIQAGLADGAREVIVAIKAQPTSNYHLAAVKEKIVLGPVGRNRRGFDVLILGTDWRTAWFEKGTYRKLGRGSGRARSGSNRGVKPSRFMRNGLRAAWPRVVRAIERRMR